MTSASVPSPSTTACFSSALRSAPRSSRSRAACSKSIASDAAYISRSMRRTKALVLPAMKSQKSSTIRAVLLGGDVADAGRRALVDVAEQARPADLAGALEDAVAARAHREDAQQQVDGLADRPGVAVGPEVAGALALGAAAHHDPRELLADGHREPRVGLVVAVLDVEARVELLDPAVLQLERLDLGLDHRPLDARAGGHHASPCAGAGWRCPGSTTTAAGAGSWPCRRRSPGPWRRGTGRPPGRSGSTRGGSIAAGGGHPTTLRAAGDSPCGW